MIFQYSMNWGNGRNLGSYCRLDTGGLGASVANLQSKRDLYRRAIQATLECIRITATQKERVLPVLYETTISVTGRRVVDL